MPHFIALTEETLQNLEAHIPELAESAIRKAYYQALTVEGKVIEARNGQLVEVSASGQVRILRTIAAPISVAIGTKRVRSRPA